MTREREVTRLFHPSAADSHATVRIEPRAEGGAIVTVARGPGPRRLRETQRLGPFLDNEVEKARQAVVLGLRAEGYVPPGPGAALRDLSDARPSKRAHAARRLARADVHAAVDRLLLLAERPGPEVSTIVEALGRLGDPRAVDVARAEAGRALAFRRRAGQEALRALLGDEGELELRAARAEATLRPSTGEPRLADGAGLEALYEDGDAAAVHAVRVALADLDVAAPHTWRHVKSIWKRAMVRDDAETVGIIAWAVEQRGRTTAGTSATIKSGYDGAVRTVRVFSRKTVDYVRRRTWRWLRELASTAPARYPFAAAAALAPYRPNDGGGAPGVPDTASCFVLHQVLRGRAARFRLDARAMRFRPVPKQPELSREEAFAELWDAQPLAFVRVLASARHPLALAFALEAIRVRHKAVLHGAPVTDLIGMARSDDARVVDLALAELTRRFDARSTDLGVVRALASMSSDAVRSLGVRWLSECAPRWLSDVATCRTFLEIPEPRTREVVVRLVAASAGSLGADVRQAWAAALLEALEAPERAAGAHAAIAEVLLRSLTDAVLAQCPLTRAVALIESGTNPALAVGAQVLARKRGALDVLGVPAVLALAEHDKQVVRHAAHALLQGAQDELAGEPAAACAIAASLLESAWPDSRAAGQALAASLKPDALPLEAVLVLVDVVGPDAERAGLDLLARAAPRFDAGELASRIAQHPSPAVRALALSVARERLRPGVVGLMRAEPLLRAALLSVRGGRAERDLALAILEERSIADAPQAEIAASVLRDVLQVGAPRDRERALATLTAIKLAFPRVESPVLLAGAAR